MTGTLQSMLDDDSIVGWDGNYNLVPSVSYQGGDEDGGHANPTLTALPTIQDGDLILTIGTNQSSPALSYTSPSITTYAPVVVSGGGTFVVGQRECNGTENNIVTDSTGGSRHAVIGMVWRDAEIIHEYVISGNSGSVAMPEIAVRYGEAVVWLIGRTAGVVSGGAALSPPYNTMPQQFQETDSAGKQTLKSVYYLGEPGDTLTPSGTASFPGSLGGWMIHVFRLRVPVPPIGRHKFMDDEGKIWRQVYSEREAQEMGSNIGDVPSIRGTMKAMLDDGSIVPVGVFVKEIHYATPTFLNSSGDHFWPSSSVLGDDIITSHMRQNVDHTALPANPSGWYTIASFNAPYSGGIYGVKLMIGPRLTGTQVPNLTSTGFTQSHGYRDTFDLNSDPVLDLVIGTSKGPGAFPTYVVDGQASGRGVGFNYCYHMDTSFGGGRDFTWDAPSGVIRQGSLGSGPAAGFQEYDFSSSTGSVAAEPVTAEVLTGSNHAWMSVSFVLRSLEQ